MFVPNFKTLGAKGPEKSLNQISLCTTLDRRMEKKEKRVKKKKGQNKFQHRDLLLHNLLQPCVGVYKI